MTTPALAQLRQLQQSLYDKAYKEAHSIVAGSSRTILAYSAKFEKSLPRRFTRATQADLLEQLKQHRFILYGDFHTLRQSQRGLLRLLRAYVDRQKTNKVVIALEMFKAIDQDVLDAYLAGAIVEEEFLSSVNYAAEWGFPWQNFKMILDFARHRKLPVIGINTEKAGRDGLAQRDRFAAKRLVWAAEHYPDHKVVCLIGEYHLADGHLPKAILAEMGRSQPPRGAQKASGRGGNRRAKGKILRILNNVDQFYFDLRRTSVHSSTEYLKLRKDFYCIMNSPPWMKWQSFSIWEEMRHAGAASTVDQNGGIEHDLDLYTEESYDVDYQFLHFVRNLAGFMSLTIDPSDMESFHVHFSPDGDFLQDMTEDGVLDAEEAGRMIGRASADGAYFLSKSKKILLTDISINNLAEAAGQYLHSLLTGFDDHVGAPAEEFYRRVLKSAIGVIASKILNPRRKVMELHHIRQVARRFRSRKLAGPAALRRQTANAVLRFDRFMDLRLAGANPSFAAPPRGIVKLDQQTNYEVSRSVGQMLGFTLYKKVIANKEPASKIRRLFKRQIPGPEALWDELVELYQLMQK